MSITKKVEGMPLQTKPMTAQTPISVVLMLGLAASGQAIANPSGATVVNGSASFEQAGNSLTITNSPNAIINWNEFSIAQDELTRFVQQSSQSAVLNRVVGGDPSQILGQLQSNGQVFLINPNGIVFGANSVIDTAGLVASSLNLSDSDFLEKNLKFVGDATAGAVSNAGSITTQTGGQVLLIAPSVENSGIIHSPEGEILLAAGHSVLLVNTLDPEVRVEITAAGEALNLGALVAAGGSVGMYGELLTQAGTIDANSAVAEGGRVYLRAGGEISMAGNSVTTADGASGGGSVTVTSGVTTTLDAGSVVHANAVVNGDGGDVVIWSDGTTHFNGHIEARGGELGGDGGFVEVSGYQQLNFNGSVDTSAPNGAKGELLLDPTNITIGTTADLNGDATTGDDVAGDIASGDYPGATSLITASQLSTLLNDNNVTLEATNDITVAAAISKDSVTATALTLSAGNNITINAPITSVASVTTGSKLDLTLIPDADLSGGGAAAIYSTIDLNGGLLDITQGSATMTTTWGQTATINANTTVGHLLMNGGGIYGSGDVSVTDSMTWAGGAALGGSGTTTVESGATLTVSGTGGRLSDTRTFTNIGSATIGANISTLATSGQKTVNNEGSWDFINDSGVTYSNTASDRSLVFNNSGSVVKSAGTGTSILGGLTNTGTITVNSGTIGTRDGVSFGTAVAYTHSGTFIANAGATFDFFGGTNSSHTLDTGAVLGGLGTLKASGGSLIWNSSDTTPMATFSIVSGKAFINSDLSVANLTMGSGGQLHGSTTVSVTDALVLAGAMGGTGTTIVESGATMSGGVALDATRTLINRGAATQTGNITITNSAGQKTIINEGTWDIAGNFSVDYSNPLSTNSLVFNNSGTITKTAGTGTSSLDGLNNAGAVIANTGDVVFSKGYYSGSSQTHSGTFTAAAGARVYFNGGVHNLTSTAEVNGAGKLVVGGLIQLNVADGATIQTGVMDILAGGTANLDTDVTLTNLNLSGGHLAGSGNVTVQGAMTWNLDGTMSGSGTTLIESGATLTVSGLYSAMGLGDTRTLINRGSATVSSNIKTLASAGQKTIINEGSWDITNDADVLYLSTATDRSIVFNNSGTLIKSGGTADTNIAGLTNSGSVTVDAGWLLLQDGDLNGGVYTHSGSFIVNPSPSHITFNTGTHRFDDGSLLSGTGSFLKGSGAIPFELIGTGSGLTIDTGTTVSLADLLPSGSGNLTNLGTLTADASFAGTINNLGTATLGTVTLGGLTNSGTLNVNGNATVGGAQARLIDGVLDLGSGSTLTKDGGLLTWEGGSITGSGTLAYINGALFEFGGSGDRVIDNPNLTFNFTDLDLPSGSLTLRAGELVFDTTPTTGVTNIPLATLLNLEGGTLTNNGPLNVSGTFGLYGGTLAGAGAINITGGTIDMPASSTVNWTATGPMTNTGTMTLSNRTISSAVTNSGVINSDGALTFTQLFTNQGTFSANAGTTTFVAGLTQGAGTTLLNGGDIVGDVTLDGGVLGGSGVITGNVTLNAGSLAPGFSPGTIDIVGDLFLGAASSTDIELWGTTAGLYDLVTVTGNATLGGTLNVTTGNGYLPVVGDSITFLTYGTNGGSYALSNLPVSTYTTVGLSGITMGVGAAPLPPPLPPPLATATTSTDAVVSESMDLLATSLGDEFIELYLQNAEIEQAGIDGAESVTYFAGLSNDLYMSLMGSAYNDEWEDETRLICR
jgi:filamentous hemagglutinin family protein